MQSASLSRAHFLLALAVVAIWGSNFVVIKQGLTHLPPLFFAALRFTLAFAPAALFVKRPKVSWANLIGYGLLLGVGQFGLLFVALKGHITPGLASLVIQMQVFFTIGLAVARAGERLKAYQLAALALAAAGLGLIIVYAGGSATPLGLGLVLLAALSWAFANMLMRGAGRIDMLAYVVWASIFSVPPLLALSFTLEGWQADWQGLLAADTLTWAAVIWQAVANTMFGFGAWGWLLARYPTATVTPMALLVPFFGMASSALLLGEPMQGWKLIASALVIGGLALNLLWPRLANPPSAPATR
ncbi:MAG: EamA family transporter [Alphaproteobacteria bacterium]|nr:EamA family transporter [Alphaproteobacteria bacterium]